VALGHFRCLQGERRCSRDGGWIETADFGLSAVCFVSAPRRFAGRGERVPIRRAMDRRTPSRS